ncbi:hypothetical protein ACLOJK_030002 [Asimina triloba]
MGDPLKKRKNNNKGEGKGVIPFVRLLLFLRGFPRCACSSSWQGKRANDPSADTSGPVEDDNASTGRCSSAPFHTKPAGEPKNNKFRHCQKKISFKGTT